MLASQQVDSGALMGIQGEAPEPFWPFHIWRAKK